MKRTLLISAILFLSTITGLMAQIPAGYYDCAEGLMGQDLRAALHNKIKNHTVISYDALSNAYYTTDHRDDDVSKLWDIYSDIPGGTPPYIYTLGADKCGTYDDEGDCYNREHVFPQSYFNEHSPMKSDLHQVLPTDGKVNGQRSNYPHGEVRSASWTSRNGSKLGSSSVTGYSGTVFEPRDEFKGDIARIYFYMATRYYGEDSGWKNWAMFDGADPKQWAINMLLSWNESDPVSQKEIDRNNAVYSDFQHNRNPFIDHPEYARMIWDPTWQGQSFDITYVSGLSNGSVSGPSSAYAGNTVSLVASPAPGYMVDQWNVYKTGYPNTHVPVTNNSFVMPEYDVTVSATFKTNNTYYAIALENVSHGSISANTYSALSGTTITMTATPEAGYQLYSWYVYKTGDMDTRVQVTGNTFVMPAFNVTINASFSSQGGSNGDYVKVTEAPTDWSGEYLIVYEKNATTGYVFNSSLTTLDAVNNYIELSISDGTITTSNGDPYKWTASAVNDGYTLQSTSGKYIYRSSNSNGLDVTEDQNIATSEPLTLAAGKITSSKGPDLQFNNASDQQRFRFFKSSQKSIQLYKKQSGGGSVPTHTIHFNPNGGQGTMNDQEVPEFTPTSLTPNTFTREHFVFDGWNTQANGEGTYYADGASVTLTDDLDLYAIWDPQYPIILTQAPHGAISANKLWATEEEDVTLTATPEQGYEFEQWIVRDGSNHEIYVNENGQFEMPADGVSVTATFFYVGAPFTSAYHLVTSADMLVAGRTYLIVNSNENGTRKALGTTQNSNNRSAEDVTISNYTISTLGNSCELLLGKENGHWTLYDNTNKSGYLYAVSSSSNQLRTQTINDANGQWAITLNSDSEAAITAQGSNTRNKLKYNSQSNIFSCYSSGQNPVYLYLRSENYNITTNTVMSELLLFDFDRCTVSNEATLTVTDTLRTSNQAQIVLADGAKLIQPSNGVKIAMRKNIEAYTTDFNGWHCIASPLSESTAINSIDGLTVGAFDLYELDTESWIIKNGQNETLDNGEGYLYAHSSSNTALQFNGTARACQNVTMNLYYNTDAPERSFNLVGNPFTCNATVDRNYYVLEERNGVSTFTEKITSEPIPPCTSILVKANAVGETITFTPVQ